MQFQLELIESQWRNFRFFSLCLCVLFSCVSPLCVQRYFCANQIKFSCKNKITIEKKAEVAIGISKKVYKGGEKKIEEKNISVARIQFHECPCMHVCLCQNLNQREQFVKQPRNRATTTTATTINNGWKLHVEKSREIVTRKCTNCWSCNECEHIRRIDREQVSKRRYEWERV